MIDFKTELVKERFKLVHPKLEALCKEMCTYTESHQYLFIITESVTTKAEDMALKRISETHRQRRAVDIRTMDWGRPFLQIFMDRFEGKYKFIGALNTKGERRLMVHHDIGLGEHIHLQLDRTHALPEILDFDPEDST